jgi:quinol monooxygenase YgiN
MVGLVMRVKVRPEKRKEFLQTFELLAQPEDRPGACLRSTLFKEVGGSHAFLWLEQWTSSKALEAHLRADGFRTLLGAVKVLGELEDVGKKVASSTS